MRVDEAARADATAAARVARASVPVAMAAAGAVPPTALPIAGARAPAAAPVSWFGPLNPPISTWRGQRVWIIGASTGIGAALAHSLMAQGARVALSARGAQALEDVAAAARPATPPGGAAGDLAGAASGGATAGDFAPVVLPCDVTDGAGVHAATAALLEKWGGFDLVLLVAGTYVEMRADAFDLARARQLFEVNLYGALNVVDAVVPTLLAQGAGGIALVSSVAGYIGLPKALVYGASKAALINLAESMYGDLRPHGIGVYLINPGFVDTPLTSRNQFRMPALISAADAAARTLRGIAAGRFEIHYPKRFTLWLKLLRIAPYRLQLLAVRRFTGL
jgi:NAD(P)-dependent dehydrogenase (short-subunit alcohol dehydrogenase family)